MIPLLSRLVPLTVQTVMPFVFEMAIAPFLRSPLRVPNSLLAKHSNLHLAVLASVKELLNASFPLAKMFLHSLARCPHRLHRQLTL